MGDVVEDLQQELSQLMKSNAVDIIKLADYIYIMILSTTI